MIYLDAPLEEFSVKYDLPIQSEICPHCKQYYYLNKPFRMKGYAGLEMQHHGCDKKLPFMITPISKEEIDFWSTVI